MKNFSVMYVTPEIQNISVEIEQPILIGSNSIEDLYKDPNDYSDFFE